MRNRLHIGKVAARQLQVDVRFGENQQHLLVVDLERLGQSHDRLGLGSLQRHRLDDADGAGLSLVGQRAAAGQLLELLVELEAVIAGLGTEDAAASREQGRLDAARTGAAGAFLTLEFARRAGNFVALLRLVRTLTLDRKSVV